MSSPTDEDLKAALQDLRSQHPSLGTQKIHVLLLATQPGWTVSEKRVRKILQAEGLVVVPPKPKLKDEAEENTNKGTIYPSSRIIEGLNVNQWTNKVIVKDFGRAKGKGLVASEDIKEGDVVWKEDPWMVSAEWFISLLYFKGACMTLQYL